MTQYTITLPDGTCVEGDAPHYVLQMATVLRDGYEEDDDEGDDITVEYGGSNTYDEGDTEQSSTGPWESTTLKCETPYGRKLVQMSDLGDDTLEDTSGIQLHDSIEEEW